MADYSFNANTWWIAHGNGDDPCPGFSQAGDTLTSNSPFVEQFYTKVEWEARLNELQDATQAYEYRENYGSVDKDIPDDVETVDHLLYTDQIDHELYGDRGFRIGYNPLRKEH